MTKRKLFLDFDNIYQKKTPDDGMIVLANNYSSDNTINVTTESYSRKDILQEFENCFEELLSKREKIDLRSDVEFNKMYSFNKFFLPLAQWIYAIENLLERKLIDINTTIIFSSYANNSRVFIVEAEGETNRLFLYRKSYFLSFYVDRYLKRRQFNNIITLKNYTIRAIFSYYLRGLLILNFKTIQLLFYKVFVWRRKFNMTEIQSQSKYLTISSRGIIQTQFAEGLYNYASERIVMVINESSSAPFRNFNAAKAKFNTFFYAEGNITFKQLFKEYLNAVLRYFQRNSLNQGNFLGVDINLQKLLPEQGLNVFHMNTYAMSVKNAIDETHKMGYRTRKLVSFEMLTPFSHYLKVKTSIPVVQIQSTAMLAWEYPSFTYADKFYFSSERVLKEHLLVNTTMESKFGILNNLKFIGLERKNRKTEFEILTYFTQPIYYEEENKMIEFLMSFCEKYGKTLQIKLHPRSPKPNTSLEGVKILDGDISSQDAVIHSDLIITRNSSVGADGWFTNTPIIFLVNSSLKMDGVSYIPKDYKGAIDYEISIDTLNSKLDEIIYDFYSHSFHEEFKVDGPSLMNELMK